MFRIPKALATCIRKRREELGFTEVELSRTLGIEYPEFVGMVEAGTRRFALNQIPRVA